MFLFVLEKLKFLMNRSIDFSLLLNLICLRLTYRYFYVNLFLSSCIKTIYSTNGRKYDTDGEFII